MVPVRVRGKRYRQKPIKSGVLPMGGSTSEASKGQHKRAVSSVPPTSSPHKTARLEHHASTKENSYAASPLQRLPTEILEMIFMYSLNLSLPRASPVLGKRLASNHIKTNLFLLIFPSEDKELRHIDYLLGILGTEESIGNLQSDILAVKWATPAFVGELTEPFMVRAIVHVFRNLGLGWLDRDRKVKVKSPKKDFHIINFDKGVLDITKEPNADVVSLFYKRAMDGAKIQEEIHTHTEFMDREWPSVFENRLLEMYPAFREGTISISSYDLRGIPPTGFRCFQSRLIFCAASFRIPAKLLHGPWSDDKCTELLRISRGGGRIDRTGSTMDEEIADTGLSEAIIEGSEKAIVALIGSFSMYEDTPYYKRENDCPTCHIMSKDPERLHGTHCEDHIHRFCVGVTVRTEHVKLALNKECSYRILYMLLHAMKLDVDWADTELTAWAVQKKKEDDERGPWLLDRLASSNIARYEEDLRNRSFSLGKRRKENFRDLKPSRER